MASLNKVFLIGNLTRTPELRYTPSGTAVADLRLAVNRNYTTQGGEKRDETCFLTVVVWGKQAESCGEYLDKGSPIMVEGRLQTRDWETKDGQKRSVVEVVAERVQFMGRSKSAAGAPGAPRSRSRHRPRRGRRGSASSASRRSGRRHHRGGKPFRQRASQSSGAGSAGARFASSAWTRSSSIDYKDVRRLRRTSSRSAARSPRGASPGAAPAISVSSPAPSGGRARWRCWPRSPSAGIPSEDMTAMKIILMDDVPTLGRRGDVRDVSDGYARNFLLPQKLALHATAANLKNIERSRRARTRRPPSYLAGPRSQAQAIEALHFTQRRQASDEGRLFGSVGRRDLAAFLSQHGIEVERRRIGLDEPIKTLGEFSRPGAPARRRHRPAQGVRDPGVARGHPHRPAHLQDPAPQPGGRAGRAGGDPAGAREPAQGHRAPQARRLLQGRPPQDLRRHARASSSATSRWTCSPSRRSCSRRASSEEVGGPAALASLVEEAATAAHLLSYGGIVREKAAPARPHPHRHRDHRAELRGPRRRGQAARRRGAADLPDLRAAHAGLGLPGAGHPEGHLRAHREALRPQGAHHRPRHRLRRARPDDVGLPAERLHHHRGPALHGQDRLRAEHRQVRRGRGPQAGAGAEPRDVQGAARAAAALRRGARSTRTRCAPAISTRGTGRA